MMAWCLRPWNVVEKVVGFNIILNIHHQKKNLKIGDSMAHMMLIDNLLVMLAKRKLIIQKN
jgi:hypothetical protein